jgi:hypothetical protein
MSPRSTTRMLVAIAITSMLVARLVEFDWSSDVPHVMDEVAYELQAGMLAIGRIFGPERRPIAALHQWFVEDRGIRHGIFPPGFPAVLSLGVLFHAVAWVNPLLHGLTTLGISMLGQRLRDARVGVAVALAYGFNPQALLLAATRMSHTFAALLATVALGLVVDFAFAQRRMTNGSRWRADAAIAWSSGLALGWLVATRPLCAVAIGTCVVIGLIVAAKERRLRPAHLFALLGLLPPLVLLGAYNAALTGHPFRMPQSNYFDSHLPPMDIALFRYAPHCNDLGFGPTHGCELTYGTRGHTLVKAALNSMLNLRASLGLAAGGGAWIVASLAALFLSSSRRIAALLLAPQVLVVLGYATYWHAGTCYGARFYHTALPFAVLAAIVGLDALAARSRLGGRLAATIALFAIAGTLFGALRAKSEVTGRYWGTDDRFHRFAESYHGPDALVLVAFRTASVTNPPYFWTGPPIGFWTNGVRILGAQSANAPLLDGPLVFARYHPALLDSLRESFPSRRMVVYLAADDPEEDAVLSLDEFRRLSGGHVITKPPADNF